MNPPSCNRTFKSIGESSRQYANFPDCDGEKGSRNGNIGTLLAHPASNTPRTASPLFPNTRTSIDNLQ